VSESIVPAASVEVVTPESDAREKSTSLVIDKLEARLKQRMKLAAGPLQLVEELGQVKHGFSDGIYTRQIVMPAGQLLTSKIHNIDNPFAVLSGLVSVWTKQTGWETYSAGHLGLTRPGTRRVLLVHEDTTWVTFHPNPTNERDLKKIEETLILPHPEEVDITPEEQIVLDEFIAAACQRFLEYQARKMLDGSSITRQNETVPMQAKTLNLGGSS